MPVGDDDLPAAHVRSLGAVAERNRSAAAQKASRRASALPGKKNFTVQRRADFPLRLTFKDFTGSAINFTGFTVAAQVYDDSRTTKYADFTVAYTNRTGGIVDISLSDTDTANFTPDILKYDVLLTDGSGNKEYYLEGTLFISEGYTA